MGLGPRTVAIGCYQDGLNGVEGHGVTVVVDVIRATTTAVTAVAAGRRCFPVTSLEAAMELAERLDDPLLVGELGGNMPYGFDLTNSPAQIVGRTDLARPMILLSTSGTQLMCAASGSVYVACLRNYGALVRHLARAAANVAVIGAGARGEFREEDALCCAWVTAGLLDAGFEAADERTAEIVEGWVDRPVDSVLDGKSSAYLRATGQLHDLEFILSHVDDLDSVFALRKGEIVIERNEASVARG
jgi:2-phosphosulfolactate phosphatase